MTTYRNTFLKEGHSASRVTLPGGKKTAIKRAAPSSSWEARVVAPKTVEVALNDGGTRRLIAGKLFLNLTHASIPIVPGLADARPLTHIEALDLERLPDHLIVLGGGYVGLELAQAYRRFGSRVTVVEHGARLASREYFALIFSSFCPGRRPSFRRDLQRDGPR